MINRDLKYIDAYMIFDDLSKTPDYKLPTGYTFRFFEDGDQKHWIDIEVSSGDIIDTKAGFEKFEEYYGKYVEDLKTRLLFVVDENNNPVATATGFMLEKPINEKISGNLHWVAVRKEFQGKGLSKPLITEAMKVMYKHGHKGSLLHSQTHTWLACQIYKSLGWKPYKPENQTEEDFSEAWQIIDSQRI